MSKLTGKHAGFTIVEALAALAIIGVSVLGVGSVIRSVYQARLKNQIVSQMIELESRVVRSLQNYNSYECNLPAATGTGTAKQALIAAVESTAAVGTILSPLAGFTVPLITPSTSLGPPINYTLAPDVCGLKGIELALANDTGGKTYFGLDLSWLGPSATPLNGSAFEVLAALKCDGPPYNVALNTKKYCAVAYQIRVVDDPANPGRNDTNIIPVGSVIWNSAAGPYPVRNSAADFNMSTGIGGTDFNFNLSADVFRKVNISGIDAITGANNCIDSANDALFVTGYDRDTAQVICAKKPVSDPGCSADEIPIGLKYDVSTGEIRTNCIQVFRQVKCTDSRYVVQNVSLMALDSRQTPPMPPGTCAWVGQQSVGSKSVSSYGQTWFEADLCPQDYVPSGVSCTVTVNVADTMPGVCTPKRYVSTPGACGYTTTNYRACGRPACATPPCPLVDPCSYGPATSSWCTPNACSDTVPVMPCNQCVLDTSTNYSKGATAANLVFSGAVSPVSTNRYRCSASNLPSQPCDYHGDQPMCGMDQRASEPTWNNMATFTINYSCVKNGAIPNTMPATY